MGARRSRLRVHVRLSDRLPALSRSERSVKVGRGLRFYDEESSVSNVPPCFTAASMQPWRKSSSFMPPLACS